MTDVRPKDAYLRTLEVHTTPKQSRVLGGVQQSSTPLDVRGLAASLAMKLVGNPIRHNSPPPILSSNSTKGGPSPPMVSSLVKLRQQELTALVNTLASPAPTTTFQPPPPSPPPPPPPPPLPPPPPFSPVSIASSYPMVQASSSNGSSSSALHQPVSRGKAAQAWVPSEAPNILSPSKPNPPFRKGPTSTPSPRPALPPAPKAHPVGQYSFPSPSPPPPPPAMHAPLGSATHHYSRSSPQRSDRRSPTRQSKPPRAALSPLRDSVDGRGGKGGGRGLPSPPTSSGVAHLPPPPVPITPSSPMLSKVLEDVTRAVHDLNVLSREEGYEEEGEGEEWGDEDAQSLGSVGDDMEEGEGGRLLYLKTLQQARGVRSGGEIGEGSGGGGGGGGGRGGGKHGGVTNRGLSPPSPPSPESPTSTPLVRGMTPVQLALFRRTLHSNAPADHLVAHRAAILNGEVSPSLGGSSRGERGVGVGRGGSGGGGGGATFPNLSPASLLVHQLAAQREAALQERMAVSLPPPLTRSGSEGRGGEEGGENGGSPVFHSGGLGYEGAPTGGSCFIPEVSGDELARRAIGERGRAPRPSLSQAPPSPLRSIKQPLIHQPPTPPTTPTVDSLGGRKGGRGGGVKPSQRTPLLPTLLPPHIQSILHSTPAAAKPPPFPTSAQRQPPPPSGEKGSAAGGGGGGAPSRSGPPSPSPLRVPLSVGTDTREVPVGDITALLSPSSQRKGGRGGGAMGGGLEGQLAKLMELVGSPQMGDDSDSDDSDDD